MLGKAVGWIDDDGRVQTVLVASPGDATPAADTVTGAAARPLVGNGFDAVELYRKRAAGVVTIFALFGEGNAGGAERSRPRRARASSSRTRATS